MKKILFLASLLLMASPVWASPVDVTTATAQAKRFLLDQSNSGKMMSPRQGSLKLAHVEMNSTVKEQQPVYYIFNASSGFVVVAGDDLAQQQILAYGDQALDMTALPDNMKFWLAYYKRQLEFLQAHPDVAAAPSSPTPARASQSVSPLIAANWNQNAPYWNECPTYGNDTCYTGCPATSLSMVFHYWKYPQQQTPAAPSYLLPTYGTVLPELPPTVFDWANMLSDYSSGYTDVQAAAVAHLMRYIGQVEQMDYTISGSGAYGTDILRAVKYFEYDQNAQLLYKDDELGYTYYSDEQWGNLIQAELVAGRPIVYCAYDNYTGAGHAFNVDGYDAVTDTYHINWGWSGRGNGNFALNAFSYGDNTFGTGQQMVIGIQPPAGYQNPRLQAYPGTLNVQAYPGKPITAVISIKGTNLTGDVTLALNDADGVFGLDGTVIARDQAESGKDITVTYSPREVGTSTATIECTSEGTDPVTIVLNGAAPLEIYSPEMQPANENGISLTSFRADWADVTPVSNVTSYTLEVYAKPDYLLLEDVDFSDLPQMIPSNQASHATDYLPQGWSFTGSEFNLEGGCIMPRRNSVITTDALDLRGYDKVTVEVTARSYGSWGDPSELTVSTSLASQVLELPFSYATSRVVLDCADGDKVSFKAGYYPMIQAIRIYAGDASQAANLNASESGDEHYRLITEIACDERSYLVQGLAAGETYFYRVRAMYVDGNESDWSNTQMVTLHDGGHNFQTGDANHDGYVNIADVTCLINYLLNDGEICETCADVDQSSKLNIADVTALINYLLNRHSSN